MSLAIPQEVDPVDRPDGSPVMFQSWRRILFLHWEWDPDEIQATLPPGLEVDTFDGRAYLGIVPFFMCDVRPRFLPPVYWLSDFLELNVRTYVRDRSGRAGVWFYSLDCNQPVAVWTARTFFRLPYHRARMRAQVGPRSGLTYYGCRRMGMIGPMAHYEYGAASSAAVSLAGSLEEFLVERYRLFAFGENTLFSGQVWHTPYRIAPAEVPRWSPAPLAGAGFNPEALPPDHAVYSEGVNVSIYPLARCRSEPPM